MQNQLDRQLSAEQLFNLTSVIFLEPLRNGQPATARDLNYSLSVLVAKPGGQVRHFRAVTTPTRPTSLEARTID